MARDDTRLSLHHVGARSGTRPFPAVPAFEADIVDVLYEADASAIAHIEAANRESKSELHVLPYCLSDGAGRGVLNVNFDAYTSSLLATRDRGMDFAGLFRGPMDHVMSENMRTREQVDVDTLSLDHILATGHADIPAPDFLSLDTQGSEPDIIEGAATAIGAHVLALVVEVEFVQVYEDQKLFGDIAKRLDQLGFDFVRFHQLSDAEPFRLPLGMRGEGFQLSADALFFRRLSSVGDDALMLRKLAFIAFAFNQTAYGFRCLELAGAVDGGGRAYLDFLAALEDAVPRMPHFLPRAFHEVYSYEESKARTQLPEEIPAVAALKEGHEKKRHAFTTELLAQQDVLAAMLGEADTAVEAVFRGYGLEGQCTLLKGWRRNQMVEVLRFHNIKVGQG